MLQRLLCMTILYDSAETVTRQAAEILCYNSCNTVLRSDRPARGQQRVTELKGERNTTRSAGKI